MQKYNDIYGLSIIFTIGCNMKMILRISLYITRINNITNDCLTGNSNIKTNITAFSNVTQRSSFLDWLCCNEE